MRGLDDNPCIPMYMTAVGEGKVIFRVACEERAGRSVCYELRYSPMRVNVSV